MWIWVNEVKHDHAKTAGDDLRCSHRAKSQLASRQPPGDPRDGKPKASDDISHEDAMMKKRFSAAVRGIRVGVEDAA